MKKIIISVFTMLFSYSCLSCGSQYPEGYFDYSAGFIVDNSQKKNLKLLLNEYLTWESNNYKNYHFQDYSSKSYYSNRQCRTADYGVKEFNHAISTLKDAETKKQLISIRKKITNLCVRHSDSLTNELTTMLNQIKTTDKTTSYINYLKATIGFYTLDLDFSLNHYKLAYSQGQNKIKNMSLYMMGRSLLIIPQLTQQSWSMKERQKTAKTVAKSEEYFLRYMKEYPHGKYFYSSKNFLRMVYRTSGQQVKLDGELVGLYNRLIKHNKKEDVSLRPIYNEFTNLYKATEEVNYSMPINIIMRLLANNSKGITMKDIKANKKTLNQKSGMYEFIILLFLKSNNKLDEIENYILENKNSNLFTLSSHALIANVFEKHKNYEEAAKKWSIVSQLSNSKYAQVKTLSNYYLLGKTEESFKTKHSIKNKDIIKISLDHILTEYQLENIVESDGFSQELKKLAADSLLKKHLINQSYAKFLILFNSISYKGKFEQVGTAVKSLVSNPNNLKAQLNVGYFLLHHKMKSTAFSQWRPKFVQKMTNSCQASRTVDAKDPYYYFKSVIEKTPKNIKTENEAKALHYALKCFKKGINRRNCIWGKVNKAKYEPEVWFERLKDKYPNSKWAKETKYFFSI